MKKILKKTLAFAVVAAMFMTGTSVYAGELTGLDATTEGAAAVENEQAGSVNLLKSTPLVENAEILKGDAREAEPVEVKALKGAATLTAKTMTYQGATKPSEPAWLYTSGGSSYYVYSVDVKTSGKLYIDAYADANNTSGTSVVVGTYDGSTITHWGSSAYLSPGQEQDGFGGIDVKKGTYWIGIQSSSEAYVAAIAYTFSSATRTLKAGKTMLAPGYKDDYSYTKCLFKIKPAKTGYIKVTAEEFGYTSTSGDITLLNKNKKAVSDKLTFSKGTYSNPVYFGVKKGVTYYIKATNFAGNSENCNVFGVKYTNSKVSYSSLSKKSKAKKLKRKGSYKSNVLLANNKSASQWYKFKVTSKRKTVVKVDARKVKSGTLKIAVYAGSKKIGSSTVTKGDVNAYTVTNSTSYGKAKAGTYYVKITKTKKCNGVYKVKYAQ